MRHCLPYVAVTMITSHYADHTDVLYIHRSLSLGATVMQEWCESGQSFIQAYICEA